MKKAQARDAVEPPDDLRLQRLAQIEQQIAVGREAVRKEHPARIELVLRVMGPESLFADGCRRHDRPVTIAVPRQIDHGEEVAVLPILVASPGKEVA